MEKLRKFLNLAKASEFLAGLFCRKKNVTELPPTDPLCRAAWDLWNHVFSASIREASPFMALLQAEKNLRGVPERLKDVEPLTPLRVGVSTLATAETTAATSERASARTHSPEPPASCPAYAEAPSPAPSSPASSQGNASTGTLEEQSGHHRPIRNSGRFSYQTPRAREILEQNIHTAKIWWYDPRCDEPLEQELEDTMRGAIDRMGHQDYIAWLCSTHNAKVEPIPTTPHECTRTARQIIRSLKIYEGERFIQ